MYMVHAFCFFGRLRERQADKADGPEDKTFKSPLQAVMFSGKIEGRFRMFIARTKASNRCVNTEQFGQQAGAAGRRPPGAGFCRGRTASEPETKRSRWKAVDGPNVERHRDVVHLCLLLVYTLLALQG